MPTFPEIRDGLQQLRAAQEKARLDLLVSSQRVRRLITERTALERQKGGPSYRAQSAALDHQLTEEKARQTALQQGFASATGRLSEIEKEFELFRDPRRELTAHFANQTPFLLFPLRLETRFKTVGNQPQLWVRVYPDDCLVDSFEPLLSRKEVNNAARFWAQYYSAGQPADPAHPDPVIADAQRAAWKLLVGAQRVGRAAWVTRQLLPDPATSVFPAGGPTTVILAIVCEEWNAAQQAAVTGLFSDLWFADGDDAKSQAIKSAFNLANPTLDAETVIATYQPVNFDEKLPAGLKRADADLKFAIVVFPDLEQKIGKEHGWSQATRVNLMPERLALLRFNGTQAMEPIFGNPIPFPLATSPDPSPDAGQQFQENADHDLEFVDSIRWVADFDRAVEIGMGFRVDLSAEEVNGFSRLMVLGVKLGTDAEAGRKAVEELLDHHYFSKKGFSIVPQGTPTNNTDSSNSGYTSADAPDETFDFYFAQKPGFTEVDDVNVRKDGQWLAEWLGLDYEGLKKVLHSDGTDQSDARHMNLALWPATLGYVMESLTEGGFTPETIGQTRDFFNQFVSGRGPVPAVRIGNQPYGILPTAAFRRLTWMNDDRSLLRTNGFGFLRSLYQILLKVDAYWTDHLVAGVAKVAQASINPYQTLLDVIGLHPNSVEFFRRYLESLVAMTNALKLAKADFRDQSNVAGPTLQVMRDVLNFTATTTPQISTLLGLPWQEPVEFLIDDVPLSESKAIRSYTADSKNYITALIESARQSADALRTNANLTERPKAELFRLLKYALEQSYHGSGLGAAAESNALSPARLASLRTESPFVHQTWQGEVSESRYSLLYSTVPAIAPSKTVAEFVRDSLFAGVIPAFSSYLHGQLKALDQLQNASTARLERAIVEHVDCCSYRLDAWKMGLLTEQLTLLRNNGGNVTRQQRRTGLFLGAYGWLENVRPETDKKPSVKELPADLAPDFNPDGKKVFLSDPANEGYIHSPSLNQGVTAAVLRNGYISHGKPDGSNVLAVNLSSERIRLALGVIEGIQGGQSLAALLGYQFERELHDRNQALVTIDSYIYLLRKVFPLQADQIKDTMVAGNTDPSVDPDTVPITAIEARNVVNGVALASHVRNQTDPARKTYPFGLNLRNDSPAIASAITSAVSHIIDLADAFGDLGIAESVHHVVMGNVERAAGVLDSYSKGNYPQEPDVIRTPRSGATLTHRVGIPLAFVASDATKGPRAQAEPSMNRWLENILPPLNKIVCQCVYLSRVDGTEKTVQVSMQDLGLDPLDLVHIVNAFDTRASNEIDDRLAFRLHTIADPKLDEGLVFNYTADPEAADEISLFQATALLKSLHTLLIESPALQPGDVALPNEALKQDAPSPELPAQRLQDLIAAVTALLTSAQAPTGVIGYLQSLPAPEAATAAHLDAMRTQVDDTLDRFSSFLLELGSYGLPQTGIGSLLTQRQTWFAAFKKKIRECADRWQKNSDAYALLAANPAPPVEVLQEMERLIAVSLTPPDTITLAIVIGKKPAFDAAFTALMAIVSSNQPTLVKLWQDIEALDLSPFDVVGLDFSKEAAEIPRFIYDLQARAKALIDDLNGKRFPATQAIVAGLGTLSLEDQAKQIESGVRIFLGDQFKMVPRYVLPSAQEAELSNSWNATTDLLDYSLTTEKRTHPQEDWLHGIARVHEKMKHLENCLLLRQAFDLDENELAIHPVQLPFKTAKYHWLALPFPPDEIDMEESNTLLYTAFTAQPTSAPTEICGLLVDEWTELIPAREETTGLTFHYDRPNCEAPQTWLLVEPTQLTGNWNWDDLVDALISTLEAAKSRGVEPGQIDRTPFASLLPALLAAESLFPYSIVLDNKAHYLNQDVVRNFQ